MYKKILVPLDGSELAECVLPHVESIARGCGAGQVIFLRVVEPFNMQVLAYGGGVNAGDIERINAEHEAEAEKYLAQVAGKAQYGATDVKTAVVAGRGAEVITEYADKNEVDLIVIATHGRSGISRWVWGSVTDRVLRSTQVPVLVVRPKGCNSGQ